MAGQSAAAGGNSASTVERAADILLLFAASSSPQLGVTEIATALGMSKSAVHRILLSFRNKNLLELDPDSRKYSLGPTLLGLGARYLGQLDIRKMAAPELASLSRVTNETATLSVLSGNQRVYIDQVTPEREVLMSVQLGMAHPLHAGASSKAFLAFLPKDEIDRYLAGPLTKVTSRTVTDVRKLRKELVAIRERGWSHSLGERQSGAGSVAAPVFDATAVPVAVVSVCGPAERMAAEIEECADHLLVCTARLSAQLGYQVTRNVG
ncbi:IclR family transcriptional regulator [Acidiferrimicrobium sp. IK]|uniref:IclR family transcriptional regulator n=1 Tax=Acidiferrimicrobium sp. IK TaxID=2871700 RepID=UPI0021CAE37E|nr:IclR family transcriptional regulator [Acidiferrimicrobium sp. IK]MCU4186749.1 IclR family transcriptional regulator [Acidiferrimicrobium sp. IK]